ncbi:MAG: hypothetical protein NVS9B14_01060 [Candidatus Acidiferrum sp.]
MKIILADKTGNTGSGEDSSKRNRSAALQEASSDDTGDMRAGFARVRANQGVRSYMVAVEKFGNGKTESKEGGIIKRRSAGDAANTVRTKELSRHRIRGRWAPADKKFSTATEEGRGGAWRMC